MFLVILLKETIEVEVMGLTTTEPLCFSEGMIGALPVFDKYEDALKYAGRKEYVQEIREKKTNEGNKVLH